MAKITLGKLTAQIGIDGRTFRVAASFDGSATIDRCVAFLFISFDNMPLFAGLSVGKFDADPTRNGHRYATISYHRRFANPWRRECKQRRTNA